MKVYTIKSKCTCSRIIADHSMLELLYCLMKQLAVVDRHRARVAELEKQVEAMRQVNMANKYANHPQEG